MLINVRGTNGSGKSSAVRHLLDTYGKENKIEQEGWRKKGTRVVGYELPGDLVVLGNYEYFQMGGLDGFKPYVRIWEELIPSFGKSHKYVVYESIIVSGVIGRACTLMDEFGGFFPFLDTPVEECIRRIYARQSEYRPINEKIITNFHKRMVNMQTNLQVRGYNVAGLRHQDSGPHLEHLLKEAGWEPKGGIIV